MGVMQARQLSLHDYDPGQRTTKYPAGRDNITVGVIDPGLAPVEMNPGYVQAQPVTVFGSKYTERKRKRAPQKGAHTARWCA